MTMNTPQQTLVANAMRNLESLQRKEASLRRKITKQSNHIDAIQKILKANLRQEAWVRSEVDHLEAALAEIGETHGLVLTTDGSVVDTHHALQQRDQLTLHPNGPVAEPHVTYTADGSTHPFASRPVHRPRRGSPSGWKSLESVAAEIRQDLQPEPSPSAADPEYLGRTQRPH
jgi:hypothetical protein